MPGYAYVSKVAHLSKLQQRSGWLNVKPVDKTFVKNKVLRNSCNHNLFTVRI